MKEYKFIRVKLKGVKGIRSTPIEDYQKIIIEQATNGWELVQIFSPSTSLYGSTAFFDIILTRKK